jgi:hypothetical protein
MAGKRFPYSCENRTERRVLVIRFDANDHRGRSRGADVRRVRGMHVVPIAPAVPVADDVAPIELSLRGGAQGNGSWDLSAGYHDGARVGVLGMRGGAPSAPTTPSRTPQ